MTKEVLTASAIAATLARADAAHEKGFVAAVEAIARAMGTAPTFDHWEAVQAEFVGAYAQARGCTEATAANRWSAVCKGLAESAGLEKPRKPTKTAENKAAARAKQAERVQQALSLIHI